ncbi:MAG: thermosome subunit beta [Candidatus Aenigmatarchaeota archaeon]|nr:TCP-1/cpn60 chaperonin family protein [Candidatus Aenigmarchaeota archaeon]
MAEQPRALLAQLGGQPVLILPEGTIRTTGRDALRNNIAAAKALGETIKSTLGPKGMDKMLVDSLGDITITNDGVTILEEMEIEHPAAKMLVEVAKTLNQEVGDGTTSSVVFASELLRKAEELLDQDIHPTVIIRGYRIAQDIARKTLEKIAKKVTLKDREILKKIALTSMSGKSALAQNPETMEKIADLVVEAVLTVAREENGKIIIDREDIKREKKAGGSIEDTELIKGIVIDKEVVHPQMPKVVKDAKIALLDTALEVKETETDAEIRITKPEELKAFLAEEEKMLKEMVEKIAKVGANVVFCQKGIDDLAQHFLAKKGILAVRRVKRSDMEKLAKATGARIVTNLEDLTEKDLGYAEIVEEKRVGGENMVFVRGCKNPKSVTILARGGTEHVVEEIDRSIEDAIGAVTSALADGYFVAGGGAPEMEIAINVRKEAQKYSGREQLAILAFADAIEVIPKAIAENAGMDTIDIILKLRAEHEKGNITYGVDVDKGDVGDMLEKGVIEPLRVKTQMIASATEAAEMILRIDDIIAAGKSKKEESKKEEEEESVGED